MLKHIVMVSFNDRMNVKELSLEFKSKLLDLITKIPELKSMEVGLNVSTKPSAFDLVLIAGFDNENGLNKYRIHPAHVEVLDFMKKIVSKTAVVDYYTD
ncbi:MAG: Dabb family protein [Chlorobi bacterium]|nr:Dabb family protein [Chlorobiota bacterium]